MIGAAGGRPFAPGTTRTNPEFDLWLVLSAALLLIGGLLAIYSVDAARPGADYFERQLLFGVIGLGLFLLAARVPIGFWRTAAPWVYGVNIVLLLAVLFVGDARGEAQRWLNFGPLQFQPSEVSKVALVLTLSAFYANRQDQIRELSTFLLSILHIAPPVLLVFLQPHLGGAMSLVVIWLAVTIYAGVPWRTVGVAFVACIGLIALAWNTPGVLRDWQKERVLAKINPDPQDASYQAQQAMIAFGQGGLFGTGYLRGEQKEAAYVPEQQTDFIFTVIGEEGGLVGTLLALTLFGFFFFRTWLVGFRATEPFSRHVAGGILGVLAFHTIVNLGMNLVLFPVVGLWLPFISYGGTALWMCMTSVGLLVACR